MKEIDREIDIDDGRWIMVQPDSQTKADGLELERHFLFQDDDFTIFVWPYPDNPLVFVSSTIKPEKEEELRQKLELVATLQRTLLSLKNLYLLDEVIVIANSTLDLEKELRQRLESVATLQRTLLSLKNLYLPDMNPFSLRPIRPHSS